MATQHSSRRDLTHMRSPPEKEHRPHAIGQVGSTLISRDWNDFEALITLVVVIVSDALVIHVNHE